MKAGEDLTNRLRAVAEETVHTLSHSGACW